MSERDHRTNVRDLRRRSIRLRGYDYARAGAYFVTICAHERACLFGDIVDSEMRLNDAGHMVDDEWRALQERFPMIATDEYIIMPNHMHGILIIHDDHYVGAPLVGARHGAGNVGAPLRWAKSSARSNQ